MKKILTATVLAFSLALAACGSDAPKTAPTPVATATATPVEIDPATGCPEGMPAYKCDQINGNTTTPVVIKD